MKLANHILLITLAFSFVATPAYSAPRSEHPAPDFSKATLRKTNADGSEDTPSRMSDILPYVIGTVAAGVTTGTIWYFMTRRPIANPQHGGPLAQGAGAAAIAFFGGPHVGSPPEPPPASEPRVIDIVLTQEKSSWNEDEFSSDEEESEKPLSREEMAKISAKPVQQIANSKREETKKLDMSRFADIVAKLASPQQTPLEKEAPSVPPASLQKETVVAVARSLAKGGTVKIDMSAFKNMRPPPPIPVFAVATVDEKPVADVSIELSDPPFEGPPDAPAPPPQAAIERGVVAAISAEALRGVKLGKNRGGAARPKISKNAQPQQQDCLALLRAKFEKRLKATSGLTNDERRWQTALRRASLVAVGDENPNVYAPGFTVSLINLIRKGSPQFDHSLANTLDPDLRLGRFQRYTLLLGLLKGFLVFKVPVEAADDTNFLKEIETIFQDEPSLFEKYGDLLKQIE